jgi:hypothetical protein
MWSTDAAGDVAVLPLDRLGSLVVLANVAELLAAEVVGGLEDAASDDLALDLAEPDLDLVQPARVGGAFLTGVVASRPANPRDHIILDNLSAHKAVRDEVRGFFESGTG